MSSTHSKEQHVLSQPIVSGWKGVLFFFVVLRNKMAKSRSHKQSSNWGFEKLYFSDQRRENYTFFFENMGDSNKLSSNQ